MSWLGLAAGLAAAVLFGVAAVAQAAGVRRQADRPARLTAFVARSVRDPWTMLVVAAYLAGFVLHAVAIWLLPLYLAQATIAVSLPITAWTAARVHERLDALGWAAIAAISLGLLLLGLGSGEPGPVVTSALLPTLLAVGVALLAVVALRATGLGGGALGALAGLGYAGSAIAVRGVGTPVGTAVVVAALAVPAYSLVAFWVYSLGLHTDAVSATTAPLIVAQTFVPSLVGVVWLGDGIRDGWTVGVGAGLVLATLGAAWLARPGPGAPDLRSLGAGATASSRRPAPPRG